MRIAYLLESTQLFGGVKVALLQAEALARRGHRVAVVSPEPAPDWFPLRRVRFERSVFASSEELAAADVRVATFWRTVRPAVDGARGPVFHLCQGYEGAFLHYKDVVGEIEAVYRLPTVKLAITAALAARLAALGFGPAVVVGQAFDRDDFVPGPLRAPADPPVVLVVGPPEIESKGVDVALDGLTAFRSRGGRFALRRVSYLPCSPAERRRGLAGDYHLRLPPDRMPFAYRSSDVFVGPSRPEEGFGLPALEALACGVPTLLSDTPGHREIAGGAAWFFADGDPESLAAQIPTLLAEDARTQARERGPERAKAFDPALVAERLERAFLDVRGAAP